MGPHPDAVGNHSTEGRSSGSKPQHILEGADLETSPEPGPAHQLECLDGTSAAIKPPKAHIPPVLLQEELLGTILTQRLED